MRHGPNNIKVFGVSEKMQGILNLQDLTKLPYNVELNFGVASTPEPKGDLRINSIEACRNTRSRVNLSSILQSKGIPSYKSSPISSFYEDGAMNVSELKEKIAFPCIIHKDKTTQKIESSSELLSIITETSEIEVEECVDFDLMFIVHASPWLHGVQHEYFRPTLVSATDGIIHQSAMPKMKFFSRKSSRNFARTEYIQLSKEGDSGKIESLTHDSLKAVGLDIGEVNIAYSRTTKEYRVFDVKPYIKFDVHKDGSSRIGFAYSSCIYKICEEKYSAVVKHH